VIADEARQVDHPKAPVLLRTLGAAQPFVIASQRVRPEVAGPMTNSAKQSGSARGAGLLRRYCFSQ
jgi:hypothetical protein